MEKRIVPLSCVDSNLPVLSVRRFLSMPVLAGVLAGASTLAGGLALVLGGPWIWLLIILGSIFLGGWIGTHFASQWKHLAQRMISTSREEETGPSGSHWIPEWNEFIQAWEHARRQMDRILRAQSDFTANAAHELRTPLASLRIAGESALRAKSATDSDWREAVGAMLEEASRTAQLVERLLTLARTESGHLPVAATHLTLCKEIDQLVEWIAPVAAERGQTISNMIQPGLIVWADPTLLRLAMENLLANAMRYSPEGSTVSLHAIRREEGGVALEVVDEGPGLDPAEVPRLTERFYRGQNTSQPGTGLGLPIARWAVESFGGLLEMESRLGGGSVFRILCPESEWDHFERTPLSEPDWSHPPDVSWVSQAPPRQVLAHLQSRRSGLNSREVDERLEKVGSNALRHPNPYSLLIHLWKTVATPFNGVLLISILLSLTLEEMAPAIVMAIMILLSSTFRFVQERRSRAAIRGLERTVALQARVSRPETPTPVQTPVEELVPGDVVHLAPGDMIPADLRLLTASGLQISEATLTGESFPLWKQAMTPEGTDSNHETNLCFMGTHVVSGGGVGVVYATGVSTRMGQSTKRLSRRLAATAFERGVARVSWLLLGYMAVLLPVVFLLNGILKGNWSEALLFGLAAAIGLTPELLPMLVNVNLARAATSLARQGMIAKTLPAVHALGSMDLLCVDKTGTITADAPRLQAATDARGLHSDQTLQYAYWNASGQTSLRNRLDEEIIRSCKDAGIPSKNSKRIIIGELPFDHERRRVSVLLRSHDGAEAFLVCKGAADSVLPHCSHVLLSSGMCGELSGEVLAGVHRHLNTLQRQGCRVLAVAKRTLPKDEIPISLGIEHGMTLVGFLSFSDPLRDGVRELIGGLAKNGVGVRLLTGDHPETALEAAALAGLECDEFLTGGDLEAMDDVSLVRACGRTTVFARLSPLQKARVVHCLHQAGFRVGFLGEGANDANALREADVGIATESAADLARECADIVCTRQDLGLLLQGIRQSRISFANILKYIKITASSNFGNAISVVIASLLLPFLPIRAVQLLVQNLLYDFAQLALPWDRADADFISRPRAWSADSIGRFMLVFGPLSCIFDLLTFGVLWYGLGANTLAQSPLFHTGWFTVGLLTQLLVFHVLRTGKLPWVESRATVPLVLAGMLAAMAGLALPYTPLGRALGFVVLPVSYYLWVLCVLVAYVLSAQYVKKWYLLRVGGWW